MDLGTWRLSRWGTHEVSCRPGLLLASKRGLGGRLGVVVLASALIASGCSSDNASDKDQVSAPEPVGPPVDLFSHADPMYGTGGVGFGFGSAYPGPALPFAMIHASPDTRSKSGTMAGYHPAGYLYRDKYISGFSLTHFYGTGAPDYGAITFMPLDGMKDDYRTPKGRVSAFSHDNETATPGYYKVRLDNGIEVEITSTLRAALFRFRFHDTKDPVLLIDTHTTLGGESKDNEVHVEIDSRAVSGKMHVNGPLSGRFGGFDVWFRAVLSVAPSSAGVWDDSGLHDGTLQATGKDNGAWLRFPPGTDEVLVRTAISFVDDQGAENNLQAELPRHDFEATKKAAEQVWRKEFERISCHGADDRMASILGAAFYHTLLMPTLISDRDGRYPGADGKIHKANTPRYSDFSLWDTYRTLHPWLLLEEHPAQLDFVRSLVGMGLEGGAIPRWSLVNGDGGSMIGTPGEIVVAESAAKGLQFDQEQAYQVARITAFGPPPGTMGGRRDINSYLAHGYVASDEAGGSVAKTQEYAVADAALRDWAQRLGKKQDADKLTTQAESWRKVFDPAVGFFHGRRADGSWEHWTSPTRGTKEFVEGNAWQYLWMVPHDPEGLAEVLGGKERALERLRELFEKSEPERPLVGHRNYYWQANEPDLSAPWFFAAWGSPDEQARWTRWVMDVQYGVGPDGLPGNDDGGTLSAWALFAASGLYPLPGTDKYIVGIPLVRRIVLHRSSGDLTVETDHDSATHGHLIEVTLDGRTLQSNYVTHAQLRGTHELLFRLRKAD